MYPLSVVCIVSFLWFMSRLCTVFADTLPVKIEITNTNRKVYKNEMDKPREKRVLSGLKEAALIQAELETRVTLSS